MLRLNYYIFLVKENKSTPNVMI